MIKPSITLSFIFILIFFQAEIHAQNRAPAFPRLLPDPKALEYFHLGNNAIYSWTALAEISLWASGDTSISGLNRILAIREDIKNRADFPESDRDRAEYILSYMHKNILRSYSIYQTRLDTLLSGGRYNCVSSSVLYMILCKSFDILTFGVITKDHAFVTVHIGESVIDVETTNSFGFDPGNRREFHDQFGRITGFAYVPAQNYRDRQQISPIALVSLILNNRISDLERQGRWADAVPVAIDRAALLAGSSLAVTDDSSSFGHLFKDPRQDLLDRLFNYGASLLRANREEDCILWAAAASPLYPDNERWQDFIMAALNNRIARFIRERKITEAKNFLENYKIILSEENYFKLDILTTDAFILNSANQIRSSAEGDAVLNAIEQAFASGKMNEERVSELRTYTVHRTASALSAASNQARDWRAAIAYIENAIAGFGSNRDLEQALRTYRGNLAADYHNRFAAEWNRRNYEELNAY